MKGGGTADAARQGSAAATRPLRGASRSARRLRTEAAGGGTAGGGGVACARARRAGEDRPTSAQWWLPHPRPCSRTGRRCEGVRPRAARQRSAPPHHARPRVENCVSVRECSRPGSCRLQAAAPDDGRPSVGHLQRVRRHHPAREGRRRRRAHVSAPELPASTPRRRHRRCGPLLCRSSRKYTELVSRGALGAGGRGANLLPAGIGTRPAVAGIFASHFGWRHAAYVCERSVALAAGGGTLVLRVARAGASSGRGQLLRAAPRLQPHPCATQRRPRRAS